MVRPTYALFAATNCFISHLGFESGRVFFGGGALRTMVKDILAAIDAEIARLEQARALLSTSGAVVAKRKPGRPAKVASIEAPKVQKARKRSKMSAEGRERIRHAQIKRWATLKSASKANMNETVAQLPKAKKKAAKAA